MNEIINSKVIDGKKAAEVILTKIRNYLTALKQQGVSLLPRIAIILIGDNAASVLYVNNKIKAAQSVGIEVRLINLPTNVEQDYLINQVLALNNDPLISGIIIQLPIPLAIDSTTVLNKISPAKDIDGLTFANIGALHSSGNINMYNNLLVAPTALACLYLIKLCSEVKGKHVVIVGRSNLVGKPLSALLLNENATVTICHSYTQDLHHITQEADIVVVAVGKPHLLNSSFFNGNSIVIDVGINRLEDGMVVGDVDFSSVVDVVKFITPVPGGVGRVTVAFLLSNALQAFCNIHCYNLLP